MQKANSKTNSQTGGSNQIQTSNSRKRKADSVSQSTTSQDGREVTKENSLPSRLSSSQGGQVPGPDLKKRRVASISQPTTSQDGREADKRIFPKGARYYELSRDGRTEEEWQGKVKSDSVALELTEVSTDGQQRKTLGYYKQTTKSFLFKDYSEKMESEVEKLEMRGAELIKEGESELSSDQARALDKICTDVKNAVKSLGLYDMFDKNYRIKSHGQLRFGMEHVRWIFSFQCKMNPNKAGFFNQYYFLWEFFMRKFTYIESTLFEDAVQREDKEKLMVDMIHRWGWFKEQLKYITNVWLHEVVMGKIALSSETACFYSVCQALLMENASMRLDDAEPIVKKAMSLLSNYKASKRGKIQEILGVFKVEVEKDRGVQVVELKELLRKINRVINSVHDVNFKNYVKVWIGVNGEKEQVAVGDHLTTTTTTNSEPSSQTPSASQKVEVSKSQKANSKTTSSRRGGQSKGQNFKLSRMGNTQEEWIGYIREGLMGFTLEAISSSEGDGIKKKSRTLSTTSTINSLCSEYEVMMKAKINEGVELIEQKEFELSPEQAEVLRKICEIVDKIVKGLGLENAFYVEYKPKSQGQVRLGMEHVRWGFSLQCKKDPALISLFNAHYFLLEFFMRKFNEIVITLFKNDDQEGKGALRIMMKSKDFKKRLTHISSTLLNEVIRMEVAFSRDCLDAACQALLIKQKSLQLNSSKPIVQAAILLMSEYKKSKGDEIQNMLEAFNTDGEGKPKELLFNINEVITGVSVHNFKEYVKVWIEVNSKKEQVAVVDLTTTNSAPSSQIQSASSKAEQSENDEIVVDLEAEASESDEELQFIQPSASERANGKEEMEEKGAVEEEFLDLEADEE